MSNHGLPARVCLITPGHLSTNPRIVKEADALAEAGCEVTVVSAEFIPWGSREDEIFKTRAWRSAPKVRFGPYAPPATYLAQTIRRRGARAVARIARPGRALAALAFHPVAPALAKASAAIKADLYVAHYVAALPAAAGAAIRHGGRYAFDAEDFHPGDLPDDAAYDFDRRLTTVIERDLLRGCAYLTAASPGIADAYAQTYELPRPTVVLNVFPLAEAPFEAPAMDAGRSLYWFSQTIGPGRGIEAAVEALGLARSRPTLHLRGTCSEGYAETLGALAKRHGVGDRLEILPPAPPSEMARLAGAHSLGLALELSDIHNRGIALSNKLFTYLLAGLPMIASDIPAHRALEGCGAALTLFPENDSNALAAALDGLLLDKERLASARRQAWKLGQTRYNWDVEKNRLFDAIRGGMKSAGGAPVQ